MHQRSYTNQLTTPTNVGQGFGWLVFNWPHIVDGVEEVVVIRSSTSSLWFNKATPQFVPMFGSNSRLEHDTSAHVLRLTYADGVQFEFHDFIQTTSPSGAFARMVEAGGAITEVLSYTPTGKIAEIRRTGMVGAEVLTEAFVYTYDATSGNLTSATLRRELGSGGWEDVRRATYGYYDGTTANGSLSDLELVELEEPTSTGWELTQSMYYRYYKAGDIHGFAHALKYVIEPDTFQRMVNNSVDPLTTSNSILATYADNYFEYDEQKRVTLERVNGGSRTFEFAYTNRISNGASNAWATRTVETYPDGTELIVYSNTIGQPLIRDFSDGSDHWITAYHYDTDHRVLWEASPSAVLAYDDTAADLDIELKTDEGLISTTSYYTTTGSGAAAGFVSGKALQQGTAGDPVPQLSYEYTSRTAGGATVYPVSKMTRFRNDDGTGLIESTMSYTWYDGTTQMKQRSTTLPVIPTDQNGSGVAAANQEYFDDRGRMTWSMDERGYITHTVYDLATGAVVQKIQDVNTTIVSGAPAGWTTPTGGGLNLVTDLTVDDQGRTVLALSPVHFIDIEGTATVIRTASYAVYDDVNHVVYQARGWWNPATDSYELINPVVIVLHDAGGKVLERIQATASTTTGSLAEYVAATNSGGTVPLGGFPQLSYTRWVTYEYTDCCLAAFQRIYHTIPTSGTGVSGTNYDQTTYGYDAMKRRNRTVTPGGTISFQVFDARGLVSATYIGTNDDGATEQDPTGGGVDPDNNMVVIISNQYDGGTDGGDGNLTEVTQHVDASTIRVTSYGYDWRNRQVTTDGEIDYFAKKTYDNLDQVTLQQQYDTTILGNLIAQSETKFDNQGRTYQSIQYGVDPATGTIGNNLVSNTWYDASGNVVKSLPAGSSLFGKTTFDGIGRAIANYSGYGTDATYADIFDVINNTVLEQTETTYDSTSNVISITAKQRYHDAVATQTGVLGDPQTSPKARVTHTAAWADGIGRTQASANYGTNGGSSFTRPDTVPVRSDTVLVSSQVYDEAGNLFETADPAELVTRFAYDDAGREISRIQNPTSSSVFVGPVTDCDPSVDEDVTVLTTYTPDGQVATLTAVNATTGNQVTTYAYGSTLDDSDIAASFLKVAEIYPDSTGGSDQVEFTYNRQQQVTQLTDQGGTVHQYDFDLLGRQTQDRVTAFGTDVDDTVQRIETAFDERGLVIRITSWDNATVGSGTALNEVQTMYNDFGQAIQTFQAHDGEVELLSTPSVQMGYADGSDNTIRQTSLTYPNGRELTYSFGTSGSMPDQLSRVAAIIDDDSTHLVDYEYLGQRTFVISDSPEPGIQWTLVGSSDDPDTGDIYTGLDRFGRIKDNRWHKGGMDLDRIKYGYDRASNRIWRENPVATANSAEFDEIYCYDAIQRLKTMARGTLNVGHTALTSETFGQCWQLDATGNWQGFKETDNGSTWTLEQERTASEVNEITDITNSVGSAWAEPVYSSSGNMTTIPQGNNPTNKYSATYDAWNRLVTVEEEVESAMEVISLYQYDGRSYQIAATSSNGGDAPSVCNKYYSSRWQCIETTTAQAGPDIDVEYVWGLRNIDNCILRDRDVLTVGSQRLYALQDANWNVDAITNSLSIVTERYSFTPYGFPTALSSGFSPMAHTSPWDILASGYAMNLDIGYYSIRTRIMLPQMGLWAQRDTAKYIDGNNMYSYNGPINTTDPYGLTSKPANPFIFTPPLLPTPEQIKNFIDKLGKDIKNKSKELCEIECAAWAEWDATETPLDWSEKVQPCPCNQSSLETGKERVRWVESPTDVATHPGCKTCFRSLNTLPWLALVVPGQQCCFDDGGKLLTCGTGAGTVDYKHSIDNPIGHFLRDVYPYMVCEKAGMLDKYLERRPNNQGKDSDGNPCPQNPQKC
ncbi:AmoP [Planctopirus limnophila DSM 3776]|uniref:AmoP n=1 Tax=Planctopirus limnophila (strain ATCC 43296 / DSM 3776 / IFAM 1008 / Mu 290) TaxID=521674 RepID=D5STB0_PLAL2|nr:AmoP [Planctopirus limnophila]ADG66878.1 AmoP [Planctopirus limnophila DSM 3776]